MKKLFVGFGIMTSLVGALIPSKIIMIIGGFSLFIGEILLIFKKW